MKEPSIIFLTNFVLVNLQMVVVVMPSIIVILQLRILESGCLVGHQRKRMVYVSFLGLCLFTLAF